MYIVYTQYEGGIIHESEYLTLEDALENIKEVNNMPGYGAWLKDEDE